MSVVGLTLGKAAKAIRPAIASAARAATRATTCDGGRERSYQAKPARRTAPRIRKLVSSQLIGPPPRRGAAAAPCSGVTTPGRSRTRATSVAKYQPPERTSAAGPSAITTPSPSRTTRSANSEANSTSWVATTTPAPRPAMAPISSTSSSLRPRSMPRVGSSSATRPGSSSPSICPARAIASASRCRSPPERSRGSASTACSSPTTRSAASPASPGSSSPTRSRTR